MEVLNEDEYFYDDQMDQLELLNYGQPRLLYASPTSTIYTTPTTLLHVVHSNPIPYPPPQTLPSSSPSRRHQSHCLVPVHRVVSLPGLNDTVVWITEQESGYNGKDECFWGRLGSVVRRRGRIGEVEGRIIAWRIVEAVSGLHRLGKVHGDIKVEMLFVNALGEVWMANGVALCGEYDITFDDGVKIDAWDLGCVLFWLWAGYRPFGGKVGVGEERVAFPVWLDEEKKRVLGKLLEINDGARASVLEIRKDRFWGAFRDEGLIEAMGSGGSRRSSTAESGCTNGQVKDAASVSPEREQDSRVAECEVELEEDADGFAQYETGQCEGATLCGPTATTNTDYVVDGWDNDGASSRTSSSSEYQTLDIPLAPRATSTTQPLDVRIRDPFHGFKVQDRRYRLKTYKSCFIGQEAVTWLVDKGVAQDRADAVSIGQDLLQSGVFRHVCREHPFRDAYLFYTFEGTKLTGDVTEYRKSIILNGNMEWKSDKPARTPVELSQALLTQLIELCLHHRYIASLGSTLSIDSSRAARTSSAWRRLLGGEDSTAFEPFPFEPSANIDYVSLRQSTDFDKFELATAELRATDLTKVRSREEKLAFAVNMYNLLALHGRILEGAPLTRSDRVRFYRKTLYVVGLVHLSLDDLLHGILRGNRRSPLAKARQLTYTSRSEVSVKKSLIVRPPMLESLCAINSTSPYDPPIRPVNAETVDSDIRELATWYIKKWAKIEERSSNMDPHHSGGGIGGLVGASAYRMTTTLVLSASGKSSSSSTTIWSLKLPRIFNICRMDFHHNTLEFIKWIADVGEFEKLKKCNNITYWSWDFGQGVGLDDDDKPPLCPTFWRDTIT